MQRAYLERSIPNFLAADESSLLGELVQAHPFKLDEHQRDAWLWQIRHLKNSLQSISQGHICLEFAIPRMGKRADALLLLGGMAIVLEYKVGADNYERSGLEQVLDYALDLKNFYSECHATPIVPILVATNAPAHDNSMFWAPDGVAATQRANATTLRSVLQALATGEHPAIDPHRWLSGAYRPTPTIIEAARALYQGHKVEDISRSDAGATNLSTTASAIKSLVEHARNERRKTICFITGVPGSGKTLAGLTMATRTALEEEDNHAVFLSGNGPLVDVLREALARDKVERDKRAGQKTSLRQEHRKVRSFIQNIHHFRDESLRSSAAPPEKIVIFDEAQRAWNRAKTSQFMREKRNLHDFDMSEPQFLLSTMDRHDDWCAVICLVGGGQEINTGEAGLAEWLSAIGQFFPHWRVALSDRIQSSEFSWGEPPAALLGSMECTVVPALHLGVSLRSFRAENLAEFVGAVLAGKASSARERLQLLTRYPIVLTRDLNAARNWLRTMARGSERYGLVASSNAHRLRPIGLHVKAKIDPSAWFLNGSADVRASNALEEVATEFDVQGLELDWTGVCWDANYRFTDAGWSLHAFSGTTWKTVRDRYDRIYLQNAYRVLLTRARQGMVIFVPSGDDNDVTRPPLFYNQTAAFLADCGIPLL